jgi:aerobic C4-dicarboxylate transport protein
MRRIATSLYIQVLIAIALGVAIGHFWPAVGTSMKPLGDGFIKLVKMVIAPIIFCTVVVGIASMDDLKKVGRVGIKALVYFEIVTTLALVIGLVIVNIVKPGAGINADVATLDASSVAHYAAPSDKPCPRWTSFSTSFHRTS